MKNFLIKFLILIVYFYSVECSCIATQTQPVKYSNEAIQALNNGAVLYKQGKDELAAQKFSQALTLQPNMVEAKKNLSIVYQKIALSYYNEKSYEQAILYSQKALKYKPNNIDLYHIVALSYTNLKDFKNAVEYYKKILLINPNDPVAQRNFQIVNYYYTEGKLNNQLNNIKVEQKAPDELYKLIKPSAGVPDDSIKNMKNILDMIWSEPSGQILLQALIENKIPINITAENRRACIAKTYPNGITSKKCSIAVIIPTKTIDDFNDKNLTTYLRVYNLGTFIHEFVHVFISLKDPEDGVGSIEEALGADMIGYNVALKIITGQYMDKGQAQMYSLDSLTNLFKDDHRNLPIYSGFNKAIQSYGLVLPYPEVYSNITLIYKKLLSEGKVAPIPNFDPKS